MTTTIAVLLSAAALSGDFAAIGRELDRNRTGIGRELDRRHHDPARAARRRHFNAARLAERHERNPDLFNPNFGKGWALESPATFGNEEHNPTAQRPHPGLPERATNRLRLSWSYRMEHWAKGSNPLDRISWNNPVLP